MMLVWDRTVGDVATAVLVEGASDRAAVLALAGRSGMDLAADAIEVVAMGGITNIGRFVEELGPLGRNVRLAGLFDIAEEPVVARALVRHGVIEPGVGSLKRIGFHACDRDLEDELIRAVGVDGVRRVLAGTGELASFRRFQAQPAQRDVSVHDQLRRFMGTRATRKIRLAEKLADAVPPDLAPAPIVGLLSDLHSERPRLAGWLEQSRRPPSEVSHQDTVDALDEARGPWPDAGN